MELSLFCFLMASLSLSSLITVSSAFPTVEDETTISPDLCPEDSVLVNGTCECDHSLCKKPQCYETLTLVTNSSGTPGECCPIYTCGLCTRESIAAGTCMCAVGALLNNEGMCECTHSEKSLVDGECICDSNKCPPQIECDEKSVAVKYKSECCESHACTKCPEDSYPLRNSQFFNDDLIEGKCVCYKCAKKECDNNKTMNVVHKGSNFPGNCCDIFVCEYRDCEHSGMFYKHGESINFDSGIATCLNGIIIHEERKEIKNALNCVSDGGVIYPDGDHWMEDECTECTCVNGKQKCVAGFCDTEIVTKKYKCKPLTDCTKTCPQGYQINKDGCHICKCNEMQADELSKLKQYMLEHNLTEENVINKLESDCKIFVCVILPIICGLFFGCLIIIGVLSWMRKRKETILIHSEKIPLK